jgi:S-adenosylmethionine hydrolase
VTLRFDTVSFLSDYGLADEFVGVVKAVIRRIAPAATVIDITHQVPAHDIRSGALTLARSIQYLPEGVILGVVDPGVGGTRRAIAVEVEDPDGGGPPYVLVGPDNGLLSSAVAMAGGARRAVSLTNPDWQLASPGPTFAGRDIFGPAAAHLCAGVDLEELGETVDPYSLVPGIMPLPQGGDGRIEAEVLWVDQFGNAQLNVDPDDLEPLGEHISVHRGDTKRSAVRASTFSDLRPGQIGLIVDSYGLVAIVLNRRSAAQELRLGAGDGVTLEPAE